MVLNIHYITKRKWKLIGYALMLYIVYRVFTGFFGPVPVRINVSNADIDNIVIKLRVRGAMAPLKGGHGISRYDLHEDVKLVKSNTIIEFPSAYMFMALDPVEYSVEINHPALRRTHKVVKLADLESDDELPVLEIDASLYSELISKARKKYDEATPQVKRKFKESIRNQHTYYQYNAIRDRYVPAMKSAEKNTSEIYHQVKHFHVDCEKLFNTFIYGTGTGCIYNDAFLRKSMDLTGSDWDESIKPVYKDRWNDYGSLISLDKITQSNDIKLSKFDTFGFNVFEEPLSGLKGLYPGLVSLRNIKSKFGEPVKIDIQSISYRDGEHIGSRYYDRIVWHYDGLILEMGSRKVPAELQEARDVWVTKVVITNPSFSLAHGLRIGETASHFISVLGKPNDGNHLSKKLWYSVEYEVMNEKGKPSLATSQTRIELDKEKNAKEITWTWWTR